MTSLEFIEKEIKELEFQINYIKSNMEKYIDFRTEGQLEVDMKQLKLKYLHQIKSELGAWEICKKHHHINKYDGKRFDITIWLNTENCDFKSCASYEDILKVKKALEAKHE